MILIFQLRKLRIVGEGVGIQSSEPTDSRTHALDHHIHCLLTNTMITRAEGEGPWPLGTCLNLQNREK